MVAESTPTLFANDNEIAWLRGWRADFENPDVDNEHDRKNIAWLEEIADKLEQFSRILPTRCPLNHPPVESPVLCVECEGRGWFYPDPPDWWGREIDHVTISDEYQQNLWALRLEPIWRAMGILKDHSSVT